MRITLIRILVVNLAVSIYLSCLLHSKKLSFPGHRIQSPPRYRDALPTSRAEQPDNGQAESDVESGGYCSDNVQLEGGHPGCLEEDDDEDEGQPRPPRTNRYYESPSPSPESPSISHRIHRRTSEDQLPVTPQSHKRQISQSAPAGTTPKAMKLDGFDEQGAAKYREYDVEIKDLFRVAGELIEVYMLTENAFPDARLIESWVLRAWQEARDLLDCHYVITEPIRKMVRCSIVQLSLLFSDCSSFSLQSVRVTSGMRSRTSQERSYSQNTTSPAASVRRKSRTTSTAAVN